MIGIFTRISEQQDKNIFVMLPSSYATIIRIYTTKSLNRIRIWGVINIFSMTPDPNLDPGISRPKT
jgi:hypothetical protein